MAFQVKAFAVLFDEKFLVIEAEARFIFWHLGLHRSVERFCSRARSLELEEAADEELAAGDVAELEFPTSSVTDEELETFTAEELEAIEELLFCTEELDAGTSCFATPATANSGA